MGGLNSKHELEEMPIGTIDSNNKKYIALKCVIVILMLGTDSVISTSPFGQKALLK